jgi:hypothetical protein
MLKETTIRRAIAELRKHWLCLAPKDRAQDQAYGATEALRWVLGEGPHPRIFATPLTLPPLTPKEEAPDGE